MSGVTVRRDRFFIIVDGGEVFDAYHLARSIMAGAGFSLGPSQRGAPVACMFGDWAVAKWKNLNRVERNETHATIEGDHREGPCRIRLLPAAPDEAVSAFAAIDVARAQQVSA